MTTFKRNHSRNTKAILTSIAVLLAVMLLSSNPVFGQQYTYDQNQQKTYGQHSQGQQGYHDGTAGPGYREPRGYMQENGMGQSQSPYRQQQRQPQAAQQPRWQLEQQGMVRIGYDLNNDGQLETFQYIPYYELQRIRQQYPDSMQQGRQFKQRSQSPYGAQQDRRVRGYYEEQPQARQRRFHQNLETVQGQIQEAKTVLLAEMEEPHVIARIATRDNRIARVDLGPKKKIAELNLKLNDQVRVLGTPGTINDRPTLMAHYIVYNQQQHAVHRPQDKSLSSYSGEILKTRTASLGEPGADLLMARVRLQNGNTTMVNLGPEAELKNNLNVQQGKTVHMLARPAYIAGQKALVAESVSIDNQHYDVRWQQIAQQQQPSRQQQQPAAGQTQ